MNPQVDSGPLRLESPLSVYDLSAVQSVIDSKPASYTSTLPRVLSVIGRATRGVPFETLDDAALGDADVPRDLRLNIERLTGFQAVYGLERFTADHREAFAWITACLDVDLVEKFRVYLFEHLALRRKGRPR